MKVIRFRLLIAALAVLMASVVAKSQTADDVAPPPPPHEHAWGMGGPMMHFFAKELNVTDEQKTQMKAVMQKERPNVQPLMEQQHQIDLQLRQYAEGTLDTAKVQALAAQKAQVQAQMTVVETRIHNELYQLLTSDQKTQLKQIEAQHEARMQQHMNQTPPPPSEE
ncbi:MAG TPA: Spy/CpxP family protein refolding chaperone [Candidatus Sulfotelmatobacter sp.]|nr:Spy/CpxP family protein refolding chaperone [Candidatus Sulfotelmatobacter sp.]